MVSDASSGDSRRTELERDKAPVKSGLDGHSRTTADLTHELAQLLAATIAQRQLSSGLPATAQPALNLAGLSTQQRMLEPTFKDGLSALSYKAPRGTSLVPSVDLSADDEPMPIPSTWREPAGADERPVAATADGCHTFGFVCRSAGRGPHRAVAQRLDW